MLAARHDFSKTDRPGTARRLCVPKIKGVRVRRRKPIEDGHWQDEQRYRGEQY